jgi:hypothetical protein
MQNAEAAAIRAINAARQLPIPDDMAAELADAKYILTYVAHYSRALNLPDVISAKDAQDELICALRKLENYE